MSTGFSERSSLHCVSIRLQRQWLKPLRFLGTLIFVALLTGAQLPAPAVNTIEPSDLSDVNPPENEVISSLLDYLPSDRKFLVLYVAIATVMCVGTIYLLKIAFKRIDRWLSSHHLVEWVVEDTSSNLSNLSDNLLTELQTRVLRLLKWVLILCVLYLYLSFVLQLSTWTAKWGARLVTYVLQLGTAVWTGFVNYLPNLITIIIVVIVTRYVIRVAKLLFKALGQGSITIPGFYRDWAEPTYRLVFFLCIAIAASIAFPLLPGADSPAFRGLTLLAGLLGAFGAKEAVANSIAGITLIYTRAFQVGDRIELSGFKGTVLEKTLFVTRLLTPKNVVVTIPNSTLIQDNIANYSTSPKERHAPIVLSIEITLGYDIPWRKVHTVLIGAAQKTSHILPEPSPFVLQKGLSDYYVSYELNALTNHPTMMERIYSELFQNIQDACSEADIEILSPGYFALRDGNQIMIPTQSDNNQNKSDCPQETTASTFNFR